MGEFLSTLRASLPTLSEAAALIAVITLLQSLPEHSLELRWTPPLLLPGHATRSRNPRTEGRGANPCECVLRGFMHCLSRVH
jgi:hypothetical protein